MRAIITLLVSRDERLLDNRAVPWQIDSHWQVSRCGTVVQNQSMIDIPEPVVVVWLVK